MKKKSVKYFTSCSVLVGQCTCIVYCLDYVHVFYFLFMVMVVILVDLVGLN